MASPAESLTAWITRRFPGAPAALVESSARETAAGLSSFRDPERVLAGFEKLLDSGDMLVATDLLFIERQENPHHENWPKPITLHSLLEIEKGRLLALPPGSRRYGRLKETVPEILEAQLAARFPRLLAEIANRPNLFFPGVFFPQEIEIREIEMASLLNGATYVSTAEFALAGDDRPAWVCLKPAPMGVEAVVSHAIRMLNRRLTPAFQSRWGPILVPTIVAIGNRYGILERIPGRNGIEFLPRGITTGGLSELRRGEYPEDLDLSREEVLAVGREFSKQAVLAYYLRLFDRKPDQILFQRAPEGRLSFTHIDFGRGVKGNYALPWKRHYDPSRAPILFDTHEIPYFEASAGILYLSHFIPAIRRDLSPFAGELREEIRGTFISWARHIRENVGALREAFSFLVGEETQYREEEVYTRRVGREDLESVFTAVEALDDPRETIDSILSLARHELHGTTDTNRADEHGLRAVRLAPVREGDHPYRLADPRASGRLRYDPEEKILAISFSAAPRKVLAALDAEYSPRLARLLRQRKTRLENLTLSVRIDGTAEARWAGGGATTRARVALPAEITQEILTSSSTRFELPDEFLAIRAATPEPSFWRDEVMKLEWILADDLSGREALSFLIQVEAEGSPLRRALEEIARDLLGVGDFLLDKDPFDTIHGFIVSLGKKYGFVPPLTPADFPEAALTETRLLDEILSLFVPHDLVPHRAHLLLLVRLAEEIGRRAGLAPVEARLLRVCSLLHDASVLDESFRRVLMEPGGRTFTGFMTEALEEHPAFAGRVLDRLLQEKRLTIPDDLSIEAVRAVLSGHHRPSLAGASRVEQILHLADNLAVFADGTRPDHWNLGPLPLSESGPRWIRAQEERGQVAPGVAEAALALFVSGAGISLLERLDAVSYPYLSAANSLHLAALLRWGLHPQHPGLLAELASRYGKEEVDRLWGRIVHSNLTVREKIQVLSRIDDLAPLFKRIGLREHRFLNASARPVQRTVERMVDAVRRGETVILAGFFPRLAKAFQRLRETANLAQSEIERIVVGCGTKRLQFIQYSYPYEADFDRPFHEVIEAYRRETQAADRIVLIPFARFFEALSPAEAGAARTEAVDRRETGARLSKAPREKIEISEKVVSEAKRFLRYFSGRTASPDDREAERFRRILLSGFSNREVLQFYSATAPKESPLRPALADALEALHENPNYLSDRSFYYGLHEITKSLALVHFPAPATEEGVLAPPRTELAFAMPAFGTAGRVAEILGEAAGLGEADRARLAANARRASAMIEDETVAEWLLSPEDLRTNAALRDLLRARPLDLFARISAHGSSDARMAPRAEEFFHASLYLSFYADRWRIENWREARILPPLPPSLPPAAQEALRNLSLAGSDAVVLYNALSLAAELRYGLSPRGLDLVQNVRILRGSETADAILDAIVSSPLNARDRVKFARKFRIWAAILSAPRIGEEGKAFPEERIAAPLPKRLRFLNCDRFSSRPAFGMSFPDLFEDEAETLWILAGSYPTARGFISEMAGRLPPETLARLTLAVSEETLVLLKEQGLRQTDEFRARLSELRKEHGITRRRFLAPATILLDIAEPPAPAPPAGDPSYRFLTEWVNRFD